MQPFFTDQIEHANESGEAMLTQIDLPPHFLATRRFGFRLVVQAGTHLH